MTIRDSIILVLVACAMAPFQTWAQLKINEVYYNASPQGGNQFVELYNAGSSNAFLDGMVLTDEAGSGIEGVFQFPGTPGGTTLPVTPGQTVLIAVDASGATSNADWECYAPGLLPPDTDNPSVSNLTLVGGEEDLSLNTGLIESGDNIILATGSDTSAPIDVLTIVDGMNYDTGDGELAQLSSVAIETGPNITTATNAALSRCPDGNDADVASAVDFFARKLTPDATNDCNVPSVSIASASVFEGNAGTTNARFLVTLSQSNSQVSTVSFFTSNITAAAGSDYTGNATGSLSFSIGALTRTAIVVVTGDTFIEPNETFLVRLIGPTNAVLGSASAATGTIFNDDSGIIFTSQFTSIANQDGGAVTAIWTAAVGGVFQLQVNPGFVAAAWTNIGGVFTSASTVVTSVDTTAKTTITQRNYRVLNFY